MCSAWEPGVLAVFEPDDVPQDLPADQDLNAKRMQPVPRYGTARRED
jgi:hypothetical protein